MINQIKQIISDNKKLFGRNFSGSDLKVSKFFHGDPKTSAKILFFVSAGCEPLCIVKMARRAESNDAIEREAEGLKYFLSAGRNVPQLFFDGRMNGLKYICQEIVSGQPLGKKSQKNFLPFAAGYHNSVQKTKKIKISTVLDAVKNFDIKNDTEYEQVVGLLGQRKDDDIYLAEQHGDLTYKNLIKNEKSVTFIDFENFGLRRVWGEDIIHYLVRMTDMQNRFAENKNVSEILSDFVELTKIYRTKYDLNISDRECGNLFLLDLLFDDLQRTYKKHICLK